MKELGLTDGGRKEPACDGPAQIGQGARRTCDGDSCSPGAVVWREGRRAMDSNTTPAPSPAHDGHVCRYLVAIVPGRLRREHAPELCGAAVAEDGALAAG